MNITKKIIALVITSLLWIIGAHFAGFEVMVLVALALIFVEIPTN